MHVCLLPQECAVSSFYCSSQLSSSPSYPNSKSPVYRNLCHSGWLPLLLPCTKCLCNVSSCSCTSESLFVKFAFPITCSLCLSAVRVVFLVNGRCCILSFTLSPGYRCPCAQLIDGVASPVHNVQGCFCCCQAVMTSMTVLSPLLGVRSPQCGVRALCSFCDSRHIVSCC